MALSSDARTRLGSDAELAAYVAELEDLRQAFELAPLGLGLYDADGRVMRANSALSQMLGRRTDELVGLHWRDFTHPGDVGLCQGLIERALAGDGHARRYLVDEVYLPLLRARGTLIETLSAYFEHGSSIEASARALFVHANTVRYRLRQAADLTGLSPTVARDAFTLEIALVLGRQSGRGL